jgi:hypothetical protein
MRYPSRLVIVLSMMFVFPAVAHNSAHAQDTETGASAPVSGEVVPVPEGTAKSDQAITDETTKKKKRKTKPAESAPAEAEQPTKFFGGPAQRDHKYQTGLSIMPGSGYRLTVPYEDGLPCGDSSGMQNKRVCSNRVPFFLDIQISFGLIPRMDIIADLRFGLEDVPAFRGSKQFAFAPGIRFWLDQDVALKFFTTLQFVYDYTDYSSFTSNEGKSIHSSDFGIRNANGLMYDPIRNVGFFIQFGETIGFMRWFHVDLDIGLGVQIRFP